METILIVAVVIITVLIYKAINKPTEEEIKSAKQGKEAQENRLKEETIKKTLFSQFKDYLIKYFKEHKEVSKDDFIQKLSNDFPNYGSGILKNGIFEDLLKYQLIDYYYKDYDLDMSKLVLGRTFNIINLNFPNFAEFHKELAGPEWTNMYYFQRYMGNQPEAFVFQQKLKKENTTSEFTFRFGILSGKGSELFSDKHLAVLETNRKYLTTHLYFNKLLYFDYIALDDDIAIDKYKELYNKSLSKAKNYIDNFQLV
jgi:hypothetical protein